MNGEVDGETEIYFQLLNSLPIYSTYHIVYPFGIQNVDKSLICVKSMVRSSNSSFPTSTDHEGTQPHILLHHGIKGVFRCLNGL
jgi:hypothetical protein